jgi:hypothetical protein
MGSSIDRSSSITDQSSTWAQHQPTTRPNTPFIQPASSPNPGRLRTAGIKVAVASNFNPANAGFLASPPTFWLRPVALDLFKDSGWALGRSRETLESSWSQGGSDPTRRGAQRRRYGLSAVMMSGSGAPPSGPLAMSNVGEHRSVSAERD